ncbi:MAG: hypothetical protein AAJB65_00040 [Candidatus Hodgkinia cicadicola]
MYIWYAIAYGGLVLSLLDVTLSLTLNNVSIARGTDLVVYNLCEYFNKKGFERLDVPLMVSGLVRRDLTSAMRAGGVAGIKMVYKHGVVLRPERYCDLGRFRQFVQFDFDAIGLCSLLADVHIVLCVCDLINSLGCERYVRCVLNAKRVLLGFADVLGVLHYSSKRARLFAVLDKSSTLCFAAVKNLLGAGRLDASGDFVPGLGLSAQFVGCKLGLAIGLFDQVNRLSNFKVNLAFLLLRSSRLGEFGIKEILYCGGVLIAYGLLESFVVLRPLLSRGLAYYTGVIFEVMSSVVLVSNKNVFVKVGSLMGGGRFDCYVDGFAVGCSLGVTRSLTFLDCIKRGFTAQPAPRSACVCVNSLEGFGFAQTTLAPAFRMLGLSTKVLFGLSFSLALKLAREDLILLFYSSEGWLVKLMSKRAYLQSRVSNSTLWRSLYIDQFWSSNVNVHACVRALLLNSKIKW